MVNSKYSRLVDIYSSIREQDFNKLLYGRNFSEQSVIILRKIILDKQCQKIVAKQYGVSQAFISGLISRFIRAKMFKCETCGRVFLRSCNLSAHVKTCKRSQSDDY
jgi:hypothetical protein